MRQNSALNNNNHHNNNGFAGRQHRQSVARRPDSSRTAEASHKTSTNYSTNEISGNFYSGDGDTLTRNNAVQSPVYLPSYRNAYAATYLASDDASSDAGGPSRKVTISVAEHRSPQSTTAGACDDDILRHTTSRSKMSRCCGFRFRHRPVSSVAPLTTAGTVGMKSGPTNAAKSFNKLRMQLNKCTPTTSCVIVLLGMIQISVVIVCVVLLSVSYSSSFSPPVSGGSVPSEVNTPTTSNVSLTQNFTINGSLADVLNDGGIVISSNHSHFLHDNLSSSIPKASFVVATVPPASASSQSTFVSLLIMLAVCALISLLAVVLQNFHSRRVAVERKRATSTVVALEKANAAAHNLLYRMLPPHVCSTLLAGKLPASEYFESVTVYFSDIVGFTEIAARSKPIEVVALLNKLYSLLDDRIDLYDVYKIETIGDAYMMVSGAPRRNGIRHAGEMATLTLDLQQLIRDFELPHMPGILLKLRIGLNSGSVMAGIVGLKMPRYCLFGDTVNTASRMESTGKPGRVHVSASTKTLLDELDAGVYEFEERGVVEVKGKNEMLTYWLLGKAGFQFKIESDVCVYVPKKRKSPVIRPPLQNTATVMNNSPALSSAAAAAAAERKLQQESARPVGGQASPPNAVDETVTTNSDVGGGGSNVRRHQHFAETSPVVPITQRVEVT